MTETERLTASVADKIRQCENGYMLTHTNFLNLSERTAASACCKANGAKAFFWGGYPDAERTVLFLLPDYLEENFLENDDDVPFCLFSCRVPDAARALSHRDYLGSLLSLGIEREVIGDILVRENGADIIVLKSIAEYFLANYTKAGTVPLKCTIHRIDALIPPEHKTVMLRESIASVRLDNIVSAVFHLSRTAAAEQIARGMVFVNDAEARKNDMKLSVGDKIVVRGYGKVYFREIGGSTRKGRLSVLFEKYI